MNLLFLRKENLVESIHAELNDGAGQEGASCAAAPHIAGLSGGAEGGGHEVMGG